MPLINANQIVENDPWLLISGEEAAEKLEAEMTSDKAIIVDWSLWLEHQEALKGRSADVAVLIKGDTDWSELSAVSSLFKLIAIDFPNFADGRGFSQARLLKREGYTGEIRAVGDVTWDRLRYLKRSGFDTFDIDEDRYADDIFSAFTEINVCLQGSADDPRPIYRQG